MKYRFSFLTLLSFILFFFLACSNQESLSEENQDSKVVFQLLSSEHTNITFNNQIIENDTLNMVDYFYVYNGGGVAIGDINNDGLPDIYFTGNMKNDKLYLNKGGLEFEDISVSSGIINNGWSTGVTMADVNNDGLLDIYVCRSGNYPQEKRKNLLYINKGNSKFIEQADVYGIADTSYSTQASFFDYDKDGDLDMYLLNHTNEIRNPNQVTPIIKDGSGLANDKLYRNDGKNANQQPIFNDVTTSSGILYDGFGLGIGVGDLNNDGWEDIFISNDFIAHDYIYINNHDGTFKEMSKTLLDHVSHFSMGNDLADFNNDLRTDIITVDMLPKDYYHKKKMSGPMDYNLFNHALKLGYIPQYMRNTLQLNFGENDSNQTGFKEIGQLSGISATDWSWSPLFADFNNDGWKDLFVSNGYLRDITDLDFINYTNSFSGKVTKDSLDYILKEKAKKRPSLKLPNILFSNQKNLTFKNVSYQWGFDQATLSNGASYADLDNDGDLEIVINNINEHAFIYENLSDTFTNNNFIEINLKGDPLNPYAIGTKVTLFQKANNQIVQQQVTRGYQSSVDHRIHFGLGNNPIIDSLSVVWPDGKTSMLYTPKPNQIVTININNATSYVKNEIPIPSLFNDVSNKHHIVFKHHEVEYNDFSRQYLLPHKHSEQGPAIAVGDVNGDGLEDFFIGGGYNQSGVIFHQKLDGTFVKSKLISNNKTKYEEDTGVLFFDYDGDSDLDLYIVSGSNEFHERSKYYQDRLYNNDGKGNFKLDTEALPNMTFSGSCVKASDFDQDGDLDLFIGGRLVPTKYPLPANSHLLINDNGKFIDLTNTLAPELKKIGMVTDALWTDYDNDMDTDLIVVGEFMPVQFFNNSNGKLKNVSEKTGLSHTAGWWNSINSGDFDNDGDLDYVLGNLGLNTKHKVSMNKPLTVYASDFDKNGSIDPITTYYEGDIEYPITSRDNLIRQIATFKKKFPDYNSFAKANIHEVLSRNEMSSSYIAKAFQFASSILINNGNGKFNLKTLPIEAQIAPVYGILVQDFNDDGYVDLLLSGNDYGTDVEMGRYDAMKGLVLINDKKGSFTSVTTKKSGLFINGNTRGSATINIKDALVYLFPRNSDSIKCYTQSDLKNKEKLIDIPQNIAKSKIIWKDGTQRVQEYYYGSSYFSQSSRVLPLTGKEKEVIFYDFTGKSIQLPL